MAKGKNSNGIIIVVAIVAILAYAASTGALGNLGASQQSVAPVNNNNNNVAAGSTTYAGPVAMQVAHYDALSPTTARTEATNVATSWYTKDAADTYSLKGTGDNAAFDIPANANGWIYAQVEAKSGQSYYLAKQLVLDRESTRIKSYQYFDIDADGTNEHVYGVYCGDLSGLQGGQTSKDCYATFHWYTYEKPSIHASYGAIGDITSIGTTSGTVKYLQWYSNFTTTNRAWLLYQVELKVNTTDITQFSIEWVTIPGVGVVAGSNFEDSNDGTNTYFKYTISKTLDTAPAITYGTNEVNEAKFDTKMKFYFATAGHGLSWIITVRGIDTTEKVETFTDTVVTSA